MNTMHQRAFDSLAGEYRCLAHLPAAKTAYDDLVDLGLADKWLAPIAQGQRVEPSMQHRLFYKRSCE